MKIVEVKVYQYAELSDKAKEKARAWYREASSDDTDFYDYTCEDLNRLCPFMGITLKERYRQVTDRKTGKQRQISAGPSTYYSGFWSQGDGACFEGSWRADEVNVEKLKDYAPKDVELHRIVDEFAKIAKEFPKATFSVKHQGHYYHKYCTDFDVLLFGDDDDNGQVYGEKENATVKYLIETARDLMEWFYRQLEKAYEYENSDERVVENITLNDYDFDEAGDRCTLAE